jgi:hypothetical protein
MDHKFFLSGLKNILLSPIKAWEIIDSENKSVRVTRNNFLIPLNILVAISAITGSLLFTNTELTPVYSFFIGVKWFLVFIISIYLTALVLGEITFPLDLGKDFSVSFRLIVYALAPFMLCQVLSRLFESLLFVNIIGLYGLYIFWTGAEKLINPPQYKKMPLLIATAITMFAIYAGTSIFLNMLVDKVYYSFFA